MRTTIIFICLGSTERLAVCSFSFSWEHICTTDGKIFNALGQSASSFPTIFSAPVSLSISGQLGPWPRTSCTHLSILICTFRRMSCCLRSYLVCSPTPASSARRKTQLCRCRSCGGAHSWPDWEHFSPSNLFDSCPANISPNMHELRCVTINLTPRFVSRCAACRPRSETRFSINTSPVENLLAAILSPVLVSEHHVTK